MGKKKQIEKALKKARKEQKKQAKLRGKAGGTTSTSLGLIDLQKMWSQIAPSRVQETSPGVYQHTWEFVPGQGASYRDLFYWRDHKQELERQEGLHE